MMFKTSAVVLSVLCAIPNLAAAAFKLPDTGQTKCYQAVSPYGEIPCSGTGQDGEYSANSMNYTDSGTGIVTDANTALMWQKCTVGQNNDSSCSGTAATNYNWYQASGTSDVNYNPSALNVCGMVTLGNYLDWRLPTKKELLSIIDYSIPYSAPPAISTSYFPNTKANYYWTSESAISDPGYAWTWSFENSLVGAYNMYHTGYNIRCVRGVTNTQGLISNNDGTVTDSGTGLMWQQGEPGQMSWNDALTYCNNLVLPASNGYSDWRLPNIKELNSLTLETQYNPAINTTYFPGAKSDWYYSSTTVASDHSLAWFLSFSRGPSNAGSKAGPYYVRCVRTTSSAPTVVAPTVSTSSATGITSTTATAGGNVTADGGGAVTSRGVCWSTAANPSISDPHTTDGSGTGSYTSSITGLIPQTTYFMRAYAINSAGTSYGDSLYFTTVCPSEVARIGSTPYATLMQAIDDVTGLEEVEVKVKEATLVETINVLGSRVIRLSGGYDCVFNTISGISTINGTLTVGGSATMTIGNVAVF